MRNSLCKGIAVLLLTAFLIVFLPVCGEAAAADTRKIGTITGGKLNLRARASSSADIVGSYASGTKVTVLGSSGSWYQVSVNGCSGYMMQKYITLGEEFTHIGWGIAGTEDELRVISVYDTPDSGGKILRKCLNGARFEIVGRSGDWYRVRSGSEFGYLPAADLTMTDQSFELTDYMGSTSLSADPQQSSVKEVGSQRKISASVEQLKVEISYPILMLGVADAAVSTWIHDILRVFTEDYKAFASGEDALLTVDYTASAPDDTLAAVLLFGTYTVGGSKMLDFCQAYSIDTVRDAVLNPTDLISDPERILFQLQCKVSRIFAETSGGYSLSGHDSLLRSCVLDADGVAFWFSPGQLLPLAYGIQKVTLPYLQSADYLSRQDGIVARSRRSIDPTKPMIALTFDDGPSEETLRILDALETWGGRATFCVVGSRIDAYSNVLRDIVGQENEIASHTWNHKKLTELSAAKAKSQISTVNDKVAELTGYTVRVLRPPYGSTNARVRKVCAELNMAIAFWTVDTEDWLTRDSAKTYARIMDGAGTGVIVLCHDIYDTTADAAVRAIPELVQQGYQLVTVSELLSFHKDGAVPGTVYQRVAPENIVTERKAE